MFYAQFGWLSQRGGNFLNLLQKEGVPRKGGGGGPPRKAGGGGGGGGGEFHQKREGDSNLGGNYEFIVLSKLYNVVILSQNSSNLEIYKMRKILVASLLKKPHKKHGT